MVLLYDEAILLPHCFNRYILAGTILLRTYFDMATFMGLFWHGLSNMYRKPDTEMKTRDRLGQMYLQANLYYHPYEEAYYLHK